MTIPQRRLLTLALKAKLEDVTGKPVNIGSAPRDLTQNQVSYPYMVIYAIPGDYGMSGPLCNPAEDACFEYQINSHGERYDQAEWMSDLVRVTLLDRDSNGQLLNKLSVPNLAVMDQTLVGSPGKLENVGQVWTVKETYGFHVTSRI